MKSFLLINPFGIGDVLFTTPVARALKKNWPLAQVGYWCNERTRPLLETNPYIDAVFPLSRGDLKRLWNASPFKGAAAAWRLAAGLRKRRFDTAIDFSLDHRYGMAALFLGIKKRIGFNYKGRGRFLTDRIDIDGYHDRHVVEYYLRLLEGIGVTGDGGGLDLVIPDAARARAQHLLAQAGIKEGERLVGIAPGAGASWGTQAIFKHWSSLRFAQVADRLASETKAKIIILGDDTEKPIAEALMYAMKQKPHDLVGKTGLLELGGIIERLALLLTNDGGPLHMASALGVNTVSIFGPVDERVYGPYPASDRHCVVKAGVDCRPCYRGFRLPPCEKDRECLTVIDTDQVYHAARRFL